MSRFELQETERVDRRVRRWCFMDLVTDPHTGKLRETLLWSNLGKAAALAWFSWHCYHGTDTDWLWAIVMGVLTAHELLSRYMTSKLPPEPPK